MSREEGTIRFNGRHKPVVEEGRDEIVSNAASFDA